MCSSQHCLTKIDGAAMFEHQLDFRLTNPIAIRLGTHFTLYVVRTEHRLLQFQLNTEAKTITHQQNTLKNLTEMCCSNAF